MTSSQQSKDYSSLIRPERVDLQSIVAGISQSNYPDNYLIDLSALSLIQISGDDAQSFLQGQFSNDLNALDTGDCQLHAYCNPKGRTLAIIRIVLNEQGNDHSENKGFWMIVPEDICDSLISRLKMFVMRSKVTLHTDTEHVLLGAIGETNEMLAEVSYRVNTGIPRHLIIANRSESIANDTRYHYDLWRWLDIRSGTPQVYAKTSGEFIPQTINLELVDGISFKKGCFPGQEIVARIKYLGKPKQRLIIAEVESDNDISPGYEIYSAIKPEQKSGLVVDAVKTGASHAGNQWQLSAMIPATMVEAGDLMLGSVNGAKLNRITLPYPVI